MRIFTDDGDAVPVTVLDVSDNRVTRSRPENDGYSARPGGVWRARVASASRGRPPGQGGRGSRGAQGVPSRPTSPPATNPGPHSVGLFAVGQTWSTTGTSIGKGFTGTIKRHNFGSQRASYRQQPFAQRAGLDLDGAGPGPRVSRARRCPGTSATSRAPQNLDIVRIDEGAPAAAGARRGAGREGGHGGRAPGGPPQRRPPPPRRGQ